MSSLLYEYLRSPLQVGDLERRLADPHQSLPNNPWTIEVVDAWRRRVSARVGGDSVSAYIEGDVTDYLLDPDDAILVGDRGEALSDARYLTGKLEPTGRPPWSARDLPIPHALPGHSLRWDRWGRMEGIDDYDSGSTVWVVFEEGVLKARHGGGMRDPSMRNLRLVMSIGAVMLARLHVRRQALLAAG